MVPGQVDTFFLNTHFTHRYFYGLGPSSHLHLHFYFLKVKPFQERPFCFKVDTWQVCKIDVILRRPQKKET